MFNKLIGALKSLGASPEVIILICILCVLICILGMILKAYLGFKVKQAHCDGRFELIERTADDARADSKEALSIARKIEVNTNKIEQTVTDIKKGYKDFIDGKYKNAKEESKAS